MANKAQQNQFIAGTHNASHIPAWFFGSGKPTHPHWKLYGIVGASIWVLILILANTIL
jgi:antibiotic biosynthesis monooxygenase (ABM) superfamily enzyme